MSKTRKVLADILSGRSDANIAFADLCHLLERGGFTRRQGGGSHVIFHKAEVEKFSICSHSETKPKPIK
jgi:predicted RNA binding protein YcfA (HicA-like mRNA interferase family)